MRKWIYCGLLSLVVVLGHSFWAAAEVESKDVHHLDAIVVSATRTETSVFDAPRV